MMENLKSAFQQAAVRYRNWMQPVHIDGSIINHIFAPGGGKYTRTPSLHSLILINLDQGTPSPRSGPLYSDAARSFRSDPKRKIIMRDAPSEFGDQPQEPDREIETSSAIWYTEGYILGKKTVGILIRRNAENYNDLTESFVFGLYGNYEKDGSFRVKKIMLPEIDRNRKTRGLYYERLSPENVERALRYAESCVQQLFAGKNLTPMKNLQSAGYWLDWKFADRGRWHGGGQPKNGPAPS